MFTASGQKQVYRILNDCCICINISCRHCLLTSTYKCICTWHRHGLLSLMYIIIVSSTPLENKCGSLRLSSVTREP